MADQQRLTAAAGIMGQALGGLAVRGSNDFDSEFHIEDDRVWARVTLASGDVYEISTRWVAEDSP